MLMFMRMVTKRSGRILIVDDEPDLREILRDEFSSLGFSVCEAESGREAFEMVCAQAIDIVVTDIRMVKGSGVELLEKIRKEKPSRPGVILVTGFADISRAEIYEKGADAIIGKPFDLDTLTDAAIRILEPIPQRWAAPLKDPITFGTIRQAFPSLISAIKSRDLCFGRGGFCLKNPSQLPRTGDRFEFELSFSDRSPCFKGVGACRWTRQKQQDSQSSAAGVEILGLEPASYEIFKAVLADTEPIALIPRG